MLKWFKGGEIIESQNFSSVEDEHSIAKLFLLVSRTDNDVQYRCEASNEARFPTVSQITNFSVILISLLNYLKFTQHK